MPPKQWAKMEASYMKELELHQAAQPRTALSRALAVGSLVLSLFVAASALLVSWLTRRSVFVAWSMLGLLTAFGAWLAFERAQQSVVAYRRGNDVAATALARSARSGAALVAVCIILTLGSMGVAIHVEATSPARLDCSRHLSAPDGSMERRDAWAREGMGRSYSGIADWIRNSSFVASRVGNVSSVAPLGAPNCTRDFFTDGRMVDLNLEVRGARGAGRMRISNGQVFEGMNDGEVHFQSAQWIEADGAPIGVSDTDRTTEEFDSPGYQLTLWTHRIDAAEARGDKVYSGTYEKRARAHWALGDARAAAADEQRAIDRLSEESKAAIGRGGSSKERGWTDAARGELRRMLLQRATYLDAAGDSDSAAAERARASTLLTEK